MSVCECAVMSVCKPMRMWVCLCANVSESGSVHLFVR